MNKLLIFTMFCLFSACNNGHNPDIQHVAISDDIPKPTKITGDTLGVDLANSHILWKGTKMRRAGKHEGKIQLQNAYLIIQEKQISGGSFTVDMHSIEVTDIPVHEPVPRKRLVDHLKSDDFFNVDSFPTAYFEITNVEPMPGDSLRIKGNLTMKDITRNIEFMATYKDKLFSTKFAFDRFQWNIAYKGNWIDKTLVDREIEMAVKLKIK